MEQEGDYGEKIYNPQELTEIQKLGTTVVNGKWILLDNRDTRRIAEDSANQTRIETKLLGDGYSVKEINENQLSIRATNNKKDLDGCSVHTINGTSWIKAGTLIFYLVTQMLMNMTLKSICLRKLNVCHVFLPAKQFLQ